MAKEKIDELEEKKRQLQEELDSIQGELDQSIDQVKEDVSSSLDPKNMIRKHPLPIVGGSLVLGFLLGHKGKKHSSESGSKDKDLSGTLISEIKRLATRKAINFATDYVEQMLEKKVEETLPSNNGEYKEQ